jgi:hypothetical protein
MKDSRRTGHKPHLLLHIYIPSARLYADEANRLLALFREWLTATRGHGIRQTTYHTPSGELHEFFADSSVTQSDLGEEYDNFSNFLNTCTEDPSAAINLLAGTALDRASSINLVDRFARDLKRLQLDLRQERRQRISALRDRLEQDLLEAEIGPRQPARSQIDLLLDRLVPDPLTSEPLALLAGTVAVQPAVSVTVNAPTKIINAIASTVVENIQGTAYLSGPAKQLLALIHDCGGDEAATLEADVHVLEDADARPADRSAAKRRLKKFIGQLAGTARDLGVDLLAKYLESKTGWPR